MYLPMRDKTRCKTWPRKYDALANYATPVGSFSQFIRWQVCLRTDQMEYGCSLIHLPCSVNITTVLTWKFWLCLPHDVTLVDNVWVRTQLDFATRQVHHLPYITRSSYNYICIPADFILIDWISSYSTYRLYVNVCPWTKRQANCLRGRVSPIELTKLPSCLKHGKGV